MELQYNIPWQRLLQKGQEWQEETEEKLFFHSGTNLEQQNARLELKRLVKIHI